jgi:Kef-type K+ transport system membrane component KefB
VNRRVTGYYVVLALVVALGAAAVLHEGRGTEAERPIAGGYDVERGGGCLAPRFDLRQSGQFVALQRPDGTILGRLRVRDGRLAGTVGCGGRLAATATAGRLSGTLGDEPVEATLQREPATAGQLRPRPPADVAGEYKVLPRSACLGGAFELEGEGADVHLTAPRGRTGELSYESATGVLSGEVTCSDGERLALAGEALNRNVTVSLFPPDTETSPGGSPPEIEERFDAALQREFGKTAAAFFLALVVVMLAARLVGAAVARLGQPRVMGEVIAGILLGPTAFGVIAPDLQRELFPSDVIPYIGIVANLGLIFYMFLVGLEVDLSQLRGRVVQTVAVSNTGVAIPMLAGIAVALPVYELIGPPGEGGFTAFALFMGVAMSITAFPVLARILVERRMLKRPIGALALASAAVDDISAWFLIALATAVATAGGGSAVIQTVLLAAAFVAVMVLGVRRVLRRVSVAFDESGQLSTTWTTAIFAGVLLSAFATEEIGVALIFGAFVMGAVMPRHAGLTETVTGRLENFVILLLLPLFFTYTGLKTNMLLLDRPELVVLTLVLIAVAVLCKFGGTMLAARVTGVGWRDSAVLGTLMNTRGLTELIVLNLALEQGVISEALFAALVIMALVTTFMAGPLLRLLDPRNELGAPVECELAPARGDMQVPARPERSILVAPQTDEAVGALLALAGPLARSQPPRELLVTRLVKPSRADEVRGGLQTLDRALATATEQLDAIRADLQADGVVASTVAFTSVDVGRDLSRLAEREPVDLTLLDGRRPLLGGGIPRGEVGTVLADAPSDVAVLVSRDDGVAGLGPSAPILVPFGGAEHDWAALELAAWLGAATGAPLQLAGARGAERDASRLLADAALVVQRFVGVNTEPVLIEPGREGILAAAGGAALLVMGLSERWRQEGLGGARSEIAAAAPAPILFVRRGSRAGALAPREDVTRFSWSAADLAPS